MSCPGTLVLQVAKASLTKLLSFYVLSVGLPVRLRLWIFLGTCLQTILRFGTRDNVDIVVLPRVVMEQKGSLVPDLSLSSLPHFLRATSLGGISTLALNVWLQKHRQ